MVRVPAETPAAASHGGKQISLIEPSAEEPSAAPAQAAPETAAVPSPEPEPIAIEPLKPEIAKPAPPRPSAVNSGSLFFAMDAETPPSVIRQLLTPVTPPHAQDDADEADEGESAETPLAAAPAPQVESDETRRDA